MQWDKFNFRFVYEAYFYKRMIINSPCVFLYMHCNDPQC